MMLDEDAGSQSMFQIIPKVLSALEDRALCRTPEVLPHQTGQKNSKKKPKKKNHAFMDLVCAKGHGHAGTGKGLVQTVAAKHTIV